MRDFTFSDSDKRSKNEEDLIHLLNLQEGANKGLLEKQTIANILTYSKSYDAHSSEYLGFIEYIRN